MEREAVSVHPEDVATRVGVLLESGRTELAERELLRYLAQSPDDAWALATLGFCRLRRGKLRAADEAAQAAIAADPELGWAHFVLGLTVAADPEHGDARRYEDDGALTRRAHRALDMFAWDFGGQDRTRLERAAGHVEHAITREPEHAGYRHTLAELYESLGRPRDAVRTLREALALDPAHAAAAATLTRLLAEHGLAGRAEIASRLALAENPDADDLHEQRGWLCLRRGEADAAADHFAAALRARPGAAGPRHGLQAALLARRPVMNAVVRWGEAAERFARRPGRLAVLAAGGAAAGALLGWAFGLGELLPAGRARASPLDGPVLGGVAGAVLALSVLLWPRMVTLLALPGLRRDPRGAGLVDGGQLLAAWAVALGAGWTLAVAVTGVVDGWGGTLNQWAWTSAVLIGPLAAAATADRGRAGVAWGVAGAAAAGWAAMAGALVPLNARWALAFVGLGFTGTLAGLVASRRAG